MKKIISMLLLGAMLLMPIGANAATDDTKTFTIDNTKVTVKWYTSKFIEVNDNKYLIRVGELIKGWRFDRDRTNDGYGDLIRPLSAPYWYYFDETGKMITNSIVDGYIIGADGKSYIDLDHNDLTKGQEGTFAKTIVPVTTGWNLVNGKWYYFNKDLTMLVNTTTPDGYKIGVDGVWIQ
ncbi:hypothetical protein [Clostridium saccharoperbutylacetonicum]|uniref:hypothetical protein n=1 Tax=Clostridium saccharoperbutylacetonicum TaxID=36745 RepID=UPI0039EAEAF1